MAAKRLAEMAALEEQCECLTTRGERCKNRATNAGLCSLHLRRGCSNRYLQEPEGRSLPLRTLGMVGPPSRRPSPKRRAPAPFGELPDPAIEATCDQLIRRKDFATAAQLAATSKRFGQVCRPMLAKAKAANTMTRASPSDAEETSFFDVYLYATPRELASVLGATQPGDPDKTFFNWYGFTSTGEPFSVYDWKLPRRVGPDEEAQFSIGALSQDASLLAKNEILARLPQRERPRDALLKAVRQMMIARFPDLAKGL